MAAEVIRSFGGEIEQREAKPRDIGQKAKLD